LVAWDVRRNDWRTFRVDRMADPALAGVRFDARSLPAEDAAAFVAEGMRVRTVEYRAKVVVAAPRDDVDAITRWFDADSESIDASTTMMSLRADSLEWLASMIAILSISFDVDISEAPDEVRQRLANAVVRLGPP